MIEIGRDGELKKIEGTYMELAGDASVLLVSLLISIHKRKAGAGAYLQTILATVYDTLFDDPELQSEVAKGLKWASEQISDAEQVGMVDTITS